MTLQELSAIIAVFNSIIIAVLIAMLGIVKNIENYIHSIASKELLTCHEETPIRRGPSKASSANEEMLQSEGFIQINEKGEQIVIKDPYIEKMRKLYRA
uniref:Uncharacterized protein n=1 Tax=Ignisphaera aggregans TaxID=334771 RepID=A0A7C5Z4Y8_9CREN